MQESEVQVKSEIRISAISRWNESELQRVIGGIAKDAIHRRKEKTMSEQQNSSEINDNAEISELEMLKAQVAELTAMLEKAKSSKANGKAKREYVYTPFQATKDFNKMRAAAGLKDVNSPMLYIYAGKGHFTITITADGRKEVDKAAFIEWAEKHIAKQLSGK